MPTKLAGILALSFGFLAAFASPLHADEMIATFSNMSDGKFSIQAIAPKDGIREFAICKAVWFAEKKKAPNVSLSNPGYVDPKELKKLPVKVPDDWVALNTTAYLTEPNPDGNPKVSVADYAAQCKKMWDWYR